MKLIPKLVVALVTVGSCAMAVAQPTDQADRERWERNREEAIAHHGGLPSGTANSSYSNDNARSNGSGVRSTVRRDARTVEGKTHKAAQATRSFTHRQLTKVRNFGERQQSKFPNKPRVAEPDKAPAAIGR